MKTAASMMVLVTGLSSIASGAQAVPAVFFNGDLAAGETTFVNAAAAADAAYNAANPGATQNSTFFRVDLTNSTGSSFSSTVGGVTVYIKTSRAGSPAANGQNGDEGNGGFTNWNVNYTSGDWNAAVAGGYTISFYSDAGFTTPYMVNAVGLNVSDWGTCCTNVGTQPDGSIASASQIYMLFGGSTPILVGGISSPIAGEEHFVAAIDDRNSFSSVTLVPNGNGEAFGAGGVLTFSTVQIGSVPAGLSVVTIGGGVPDIDTATGAYTVTELNNGAVNPVFDGGTLAVGGSGAVLADLSVLATGGTIDTQANNAIFTGDISGAGMLHKTGSGVLALTGSNSQAGLDVQQGTLIVGSQGALGAANGDIRIGGGASLVTDANMTITQDVHIDGPNARFDTGVNNVTVIGGLDGTDCLNKYGAGRMNLAAAASNAIGACVQQGTLSFNNVFDGKVWVFADGIAGGSGQINGDMEVRGVLAPGNSPGRLVVAGSVTQMAGSTLSIEIDGRAVGVGAGAYDTLVLTGANSVYTAGGTLAPKLRGISGAATNSFTPQIGDVFQIVTAEGGVTGAYAGLAQPGSGLPANTRFDVRYLPNAVLLTLTADSYAALLANGAPLNAAAAGGAVDQFRGVSGLRADSASARFTDGLTGLNTAGLTRTLAQTAGEIYADSLDAVLQTSRATRGSVSDRLAAASGATGALTKDAQLSTNLWGTVSNHVTHVGADAYGSGYRAESTSMIVGYDREVAPNLVLGAALAYGESRTETNLVSSAEADSYQGIVYGQWRAGATYVDGMLAAGTDRHDVRRQVALSTGARSYQNSPEGYSLGADLEVGRRFALGSATLTPAGGLAYDSVSRDGFQESGDAAAALRLGDDRREAIAARLGARLSSAFDVNGVQVTPYGSAFVTQELGDETAQIDPSLHGVAFDVRAPKAGRTGVHGDLGVNLQVSETLNLRVGYSYADADNARSNAVSGGLNIRW